MSKIQEYIRAHEIGDIRCSEIDASFGNAKLRPQYDGIHIIVDENDGKKLRAYLQNN